MAGRSGRGAWGGGFGEEGKRGSSDELLPSRTAPQRPTSSSYFYFLRVLLTFKCLHPCCAHGPRDPRPSSLGRNLSRNTSPSRLSARLPRPLAWRPHLPSPVAVTAAVSPEGGEGSSPGSGRLRPLLAPSPARSPHSPRGQMCFFFFTRSWKNS